MRIFLDANILFSASRVSGEMHGFLTWLAKGDQLVTNYFARMETERNLLEKRPEWIKGFSILLRDIIIVSDHELHEQIDLSQKDHLILGSAIAAQCDYLLTGDKRDFGHLYGKTIAGVTVIDYISLVKLLVTAMQ